MKAWWYTTLLASQLIRKQVGGIFDVGLLGPCGKHAEEAEDVASMPRTLQKHAYESLVVHYSLGFTAYKEASGGFYLRCGTPRTLREACRGG